MLKHLDVNLSPCDLAKLHSSLSIQLHAYLTSSADIKTALIMHKQGLRPYSLFTMKQAQSIFFRFSMLSGEAYSLCEIIKNTKRYVISGINCGIETLDMLEHNSVFIDELLRKPSKQMRLTFASPVTYKHKLINTNLFALPPLLYTVADKIRIFEGIDIQKKEIDSICENVKFPYYRLKSDEFAVKQGKLIPAFSGEMIISCSGTSDDIRKLSLLLHYSEYSGLGAKTALGMGGIFVEDM